MKKFILTQIGFLIGGFILTLITDIELTKIVSNHFLLTMGWLCHHFQNKI